MMRLELQHPGLQLFANGHAYNVTVAAHGLIMIFFTIMPALIGASQLVRTIADRGA
jgi:cytochrome c oxidase subunit 1